MKKTRILLILTVLSLTILSCDPPAYYDYFIINKCNENIDVKIKACTLNCNTNYSKIVELDLQINPNTTQLIYSDDRTILPLDARMIDYFFEEIIITKGNDISKINYIDKDLWDFNPISKDHANSYLTITPKDFE